MLEFNEIVSNFELKIEHTLQPQYIRKSNMYESAAMTHIFWCLCCLIDRHQKNILYCPLNGNFFHIDHTFPSSYLSQLMHPFQYFMIDGILTPFIQCKCEHILRHYITNFMSIILENASTARTAGSPSTTRTGLWRPREQRQAKRAPDKHRPQRRLPFRTRGIWPSRFFNQPTRSMRASD